MRVAITKGLACMAVALCALCMPGMYATPAFAQDVTYRFNDVKADQWYTEHVQWVNDENIMTGYNYITWGVGFDLTRAEFATVLWRYSEPEAYITYDEKNATNETPFPDVEDGLFYTEAVNWAYAEGIFTGYSEEQGSNERLFAPGDSTTREQTMTVLWRMIGSPDASSAKMESFPDADAVSDWAQNAIAWATEHDVITGALHPDNTFWIEPTRAVLREEVAKILHLTLGTDESIHINSIAAFGDYALIVQMVGGKGALAATDVETLAALQDEGVDTSASIAWSDDSGDPSALIGYNAIIDSGADVILVEDPETYVQGLSKICREAFEAAGIEFVGLKSMSTSTNIKENVNTVAELLQGSRKALYGSTAEDRAGEYSAFHNKVVSEANGGLANDEGAGSGGRLTARAQDTPLQVSDDGSDDADGLDFSENTATYTTLVNFWDDTATLSLSYNTFDPGVAFSPVGRGTGPFSYYVQAGGTINVAAVDVARLSTGEAPVLQDSGTNSWSLNWITDTQLTDIYHTSGNALGVTALLDSRYELDDVTLLGYGFGSVMYPYLLVTDQYIKDSIVASSASDNSCYHPNGFTGNSMMWGPIGHSYNNGNVLAWTCIGSSKESVDNWEGTVNPRFPEGYIYPDTILVNPRGYFCDWTSGTVESFLEAGWVASRLNGVYDYAQWQQDVVDFYDWAWGIEADTTRIDIN